jgi:hypothetical protein
MSEETKQNEKYATLVKWTIVLGVLALIFGVLLIKISSAAGTRAKNDEYTITQLKREIVALKEQANLKAWMVSPTGEITLVRLTERSHWDKGKFTYEISPNRNMSFDLRTTSNGLEAVEWEWFDNETAACEYALRTLRERAKRCQRMVSSYGKERDDYLAKYSDVVDRWTTITGQEANTRDVLIEIMRELVQEKKFLEEKPQDK